MSASYDLFCRWKHVQKIQSDNAGALALGVSRATVSLWKQGKNAEIHFVERMAVDIGDSPEMWSAVVMAERSSSEDEKAAWRRIAQKLATVAMALLLAVGFGLPRDAEAMQARNGAQDIHYAKSHRELMVRQMDSCGLRMASPPQSVRNCRARPALL